jgi:hypothetical protein
LVVRPSPGNFGEDPGQDVENAGRTPALVPARSPAEPSGRIICEANGTGVVGKGAGFFGGEAVARNFG